MPAFFSAEQSPLMMFSFDATASNAHEKFKCIDHILLDWAYQTDGDLTWVSKLENGHVTIVAELRRGLRNSPWMHSRLNQKCWEKIGFTELMGKSFLFISERY